MTKLQKFRYDLMKFTKILIHTYLEKKIIYFLKRKRVF
jgi:hypothetical protein